MNSISQFSTKLWPFPAISGRFWPIFSDFAKFWQLGFWLVLESNKKIEVDISIQYIVMAISSRFRQFLAVFWQFSAISGNFLMFCGEFWIPTKIEVNMSIQYKVMNQYLLCHLECLRTSKSLLASFLIILNLYLPFSSKSI